MDGPDSRVRPGGALRVPALIVALCAAILIALWARELARPGPGDRARPPSDDAPRTVAGWRGSRVLADGSRLEIELLPMHAEPERERFEALVLERRLGLAPGEPWRLNLVWRAAGETSGDESSAAIDLAGLAVHDVGGTALAPITSGVRPAAVVDPVAVLFAPPRDGLLPGEAVSLILWGRAPASEAWLVDSSSEVALAQTGLAVNGLARSLVLVARSPGEDD